MEMDVMKEEIRIDKYLADMSVGTRSQVKQMIFNHQTVSSNLTSSTIQNQHPYSPFKLY